MRADRYFSFHHLVTAVLDCATLPDGFLCYSMVHEDHQNYSRVEVMNQKAASEWFFCLSIHAFSFLSHQVFEG